MNVINSYKLFVENNLLYVDYIVKEEEDQHKMSVGFVEMDNYDDVVDEYQNLNKSVDHDYFVVEIFE